MDGRVLVSRHLEMFNLRDTSTAAETVGQQWTSHGSPPERRHGLDGFRAAAEVLFAGVADLRFAVDDVISEGDRVACRSTMSGRHIGNWLGLRPTGYPFSVDRVDVFRVADGLLVEHWGLVDELALMRQLGLFS